MCTYTKLAKSYSHFPNILISKAGCKENNGRNLFLRLSPGTSSQGEGCIQQQMASMYGTPVHTYVCASYLSIGEQSVHSLQESRLQHIGLIKDEHNLLIPTARATQHSTKIIIKVSCSVLAVNLKQGRNISNIVVPCALMQTLGGF